MVLIRTLIAALILLIPWVKWEIFHRITVTEVVFCVLAVFFSIQLGKGRIRISTHLLHKGFVFVLSIWLFAVLLSGVHAPHLSSYLFEVGGMLYLSSLGLLSALLITLDDKLLNRALRWTVWSVVLVGVICVIGMAKGYTAGFFDRFFFNETHKLIASFKNPNQLAGYLVLFLPVLWELLWASRGKKRIGYALLCLAILASVAASCSRAGIAVVALLAVGYSVWSLARRKYKQVLTLMSAGIVLIGVICLLVFSLGDVFESIPAGDAFRSLFASSLCQGQVIDSFRVENWNNAIRLFQQFPVTGYGVGNVWIDYGYEIHNTYLSTLAEMGIIGGIALLALFGYIAFIAYQNVKIATRLRPTWTPYARGLFAGLVAYYIFATQHMMLRSRHLWLVFGLVVAMNGLLRLTERKGNVRNLRDTLS